MTRLQEIKTPIKIKLVTPWGNVQRKKTVGHITGIVYGHYRGGDIFEVDKLDSDHEPERFVVEKPKRKRGRPAKKVTK